MSQHSAAPRPRAGAPGGVRHGRVAALAAAIVVVVAGARGAFPAVSGLHGPWRAHIMVVGIGLEVALGALLIALVRRVGHAAPDGQPAARLRTWLRRILIAFLVVIPLMLAIAFSVGLQRHLQPLKQVRHLPAAPARQHVPRLTVSPPGHAGLAVLYGLLALALVAVIAACVVTIWRRRGAAVPQAGYQLADEPQQVLGRAVESGRSALRLLDDARAAIIACYLAMERSLAGAGAARDAADTPDELLARAAGAGLVHGGAAADLTALFCEARFSTHALPPERKDAAEQALAALEADLGSRPEAELGSRPEAELGSRGDTELGSRPEAEPGSGPPAAGPDR